MIFSAVSQQNIDADLWLGFSLLDAQNYHVLLSETRAGIRKARENFLILLV